jgi:hypothetical protein
MMSNAIKGSANKIARTVKKRWSTGFPIQLLALKMGNFTQSRKELGKCERLCAFLGAEME